MLIEQVKLILSHTKINHSFLKNLVKAYVMPIWVNNNLEEVLEQIVTVALEPKTKERVC